MHQIKEHQVPREKFAGDQRVLGFSDSLNIRCEWHALRLSPTRSRRQVCERPVFPVGEAL